MLCTLGLYSCLYAAVLASNSSLRPVKGKPHTETPLKANESFIIILLFSHWLLNLWQLTLTLWLFMCGSLCSENLYNSVCMLNLTCVSRCAACMKGCLTYKCQKPHTHTDTHTLSYKKHLCATLLTLSASFPQRHIKGYVHSGALCSLKCSRAATDPQILTFTPRGAKTEEARERTRQMGEKIDA